MTAPERPRPPYALGFLGGGHDSAVGGAHRIAVELDRQFRLVNGCFGIEPQANRRSAEVYGVPATCPDLPALLAEAAAGRLDAVVILTPTDQHKEQVIDCLRAGVPVICEKALALTPQDAGEIRDALVQHRGFLAVTYNYTGYPMVRALRHLVRTGRFGRITQIHVEMPQEGFARLDGEGRPLTPQQWRLRDVGVPTLSLDLGVHLHSLIRFITGQSPLEVAAIADTLGNFPDIVDNVMCLARYSEGMSCSMWYSKTALGQRNGLKIRIFGELGSAQWVQEDPEYLHCADNRGTIFRLDRSNAPEIAGQPRYTRFKAGHPAGFIEAFANYYQDIADALGRHRSGDPAPLGGHVLGVDEAIEGLAMLQAVAEAAAGRCWVKMPSCS